MPELTPEHLNEAYSGLRNQVLQTNPVELGLTSQNPAEVWGVLMEIAYPQAVITLVALLDGTTSLYFSSGGGILGSGQHPGPAQAAKRFVTSATQFVTDCERVTTYPLPRTGNTKFHLLTFDGIFATEAPENEFGYNHHKLSPLFHLGHSVLAAIRQVDQR